MVRHAAVRNSWAMGGKDISGYLKSWASRSSLLGKTVKHSEKTN